MGIGKFYQTNLFRPPLYADRCGHAKSSSAGYRVIRPDGQQVNRARSENARQYAIVPVLPLRGVGDYAQLLQ